MKVDQIQRQLKEQNLDGWLFFDHHHRDPLAYRVLGLDDSAHVTRRWYYLIPAAGTPKKLVHRIESHVLDGIEGACSVYSTWEEQTQALAKLLEGQTRVAMQYSPNCAIPYIAFVDGGTLELVRSTGVEVVSSAELIQFFEARLNENARESHFAAGKKIDSIRASAFRWIGEAIRSNRSITEWDVANWIRERFDAEQLLTQNGPIVAVGAHAADPHYEPQRNGSSQILPGSVVLLDMWAKRNQPDAIYYDITWTGYCGNTVPSAIARVFNAVRDARNAARDLVIKAFENHEPIRGFQVDDAARSVISRNGFAERFVHRTGHSIGREVHANAANMDNFETHDDREIIPWSCFSIEPGIYLDDFGIRSEINIFVDDRKAQVTGEMQDSVVLIS